MPVCIINAYRFLRIHQRADKHAVYMEYTVCCIINTLCSKCTVDLAWKNIIIWLIEGTVCYCCLMVALDSWEQQSNLIRGRDGINPPGAKCGFRPVVL